MIKKIPKLRFKGFSWEWERKKLWWLTKVVVWWTPSTSNKSYWDWDVNWLSSWELKNSYIFDSIKKITDLWLQKSPAKLMPIDTILLAMTWATLWKIWYLKIESSWNQSVAWFIPSNLLNPRFLFYTLENWFNQILSFWAWGAQPWINKSSIENLTFPFPDIPEQQKIASFLSSIDEKIEKLDEEKKLMEEFKKGIMQQIFVNENIKNKQDKTGGGRFYYIPKLRFKEFSGELGILKANEIFYSISDKNRQDLPVLSASQEFWMISRDEIWVDIKYSEEGLKNYKRVKKWQFVIHLRSFQGWFAYSNLEWITSPAYTIIDFREKEKHSSLFWRSMFMSDNFIKRLELVTYWIRDGRSISFTDFSSLKFSIPTFEEQQKVASFLSNIDGKIENIKLNAESMKEFKRWMMQEMFI